ncbi:hypothetical protein [Variovorax saccharolyticus]|uniref:hypothetical protein n=1 Tax=Variovorax saccharolyticus TaxID=3053516 RepID=UPI002578B008|nr:hypothetical protein [Variovorax sp. J31P216]MDM0030389.1 hypothetical protein [Variovorax sp. J31P216]
MPNNNSSKPPPNVFGMPNAGPAVRLNDESASRDDVACRDGEALRGRVVSMQLHAEASEVKLENLLPSMRFKASAFGMTNITLSLSDFPSAPAIGPRSSAMPGCSACRTSWLQTRSMTNGLTNRCRKPIPSSRRFKASVFGITNITFSLISLRTCCHRRELIGDARLFGMPNNRSDKPAPRCSAFHGAKTRAPLGRLLRSKPSSSGAQPPPPGCRCERVNPSLVFGMPNTGRRAARRRAWRTGMFGMPNS